MHPSRISLTVMDCPTFMFNSFRVAVDNFVFYPALHAGRLRLNPYRDSNAVANDLDSFVNASPQIKLVLRTLLIHFQFRHDSGLRLLRVGASIIDFTIQG